METVRQPPLLLIAYGPLHDRKYILYNVSENRCDTAMLPILSDMSPLPCNYGCNYGCIVVLDPFTNNCDLWCSESRQIIRLPQLPRIGYNRCVLSKPPTAPDCHVVFRSGNGNELAFCQPGDDEFVEMCIEDNEDVQCVNALKHFQGNIYALVGYKLKLMTISFVGKTIEFRPILKSGQEWHISLPYRPWSGEEMYYLVEDDDGEMLLVCKMDPAYYLRQFSDFKIFRIDFNRQECIELSDIGPRAIFVSNTGDAFCSSSSKGMEPNSIYYTDAGRELCIYNLADRGTISLIPCPAADRLLPSLSWIEHRFSKLI